MPSTARVARSGGDTTGTFDAKRVGHRRVVLLTSRSMEGNGADRGWLGRTLARCTEVPVSSARPSNRACSSPAHGSPTLIHREAFGFSRQTPPGLGATTLPLRLISPSSLGELKSSAHPKLRGRSCLRATKRAIRSRA